VTSERGGAAALQCAEGFELLEIEARSIPVEEALALNAEDVGHLHRRASSLQTYQTVLSEMGCSGPRFLSLLAKRLSAGGFSSANIPAGF